MGRRQVPITSGEDEGEPVGQLETPHPGKQGPAVTRTKAGRSTRCPGVSFRRDFLDQPSSASTIAMTANRVLRRRNQPQRQLLVVSTRRPAGADSPKGRFFRPIAARGRMPAPRTALPLGAEGRWLGRAKAEVSRSRSMPKATALPRGPGPATQAPIGPAAKAGSAEGPARKNRERAQQQPPGGAGGWGGPPMICRRVRPGPRSPQDPPRSRGHRLGGVEPSTPGQLASARSAWRRSTAQRGDG